jgi:hypothetical protein
MHAHFATVKQGSHGQACKLQYDSNRTVNQSHLGTRTQFVDSKQTTPTAFDPCPPAGVPTTHIRDLCRPAPAVETDKLPPSK